jgi:hypothetical protein
MDFLRGIFGVTPEKICEIDAPVRSRAIDLTGCFDKDAILQRHAAGFCGNMGNDTTVGFCSVACHKIWPHVMAD